MEKHFLEYHNNVMAHKQRKSASVSEKEDGQQDERAVTAEKKFKTLLGDPDEKKRLTAIAKDRRTAAFYAGNPRYFQSTQEVLEGVFKFFTHGSYKPLSDFMPEVFAIKDLPIGGVEGGTGDSRLLVLRGACHIQPSGAEAEQPKEQGHQEQGGRAVG